jgi:hypothetical protein
MVTLYAPCAEGDPMPAEREEIQVTPEMIEAGEAEYRGGDFDPCSPLWVTNMVSRVFRAMYHARRGGYCYSHRGASGG